MALSSEDVLRLNVLLANDVEAIRIDEQAMTVCGLTGGNEAQVKLNPNCRPEQYLRRVRELLSSHVLGSPGGYPVFLQRWTRMGQTRDSRLDDLLKLGEPEAVVAVAGAPGLTSELARRAWWALPDADIARRMLERDVVVNSEMGKILADFLVEHLPFETEPEIIIDTVRLVLQPGLIDDETRRKIWARGKQKNVYHIGFLVAAPDDLPEPLPARADYDDFRGPVAHLAEKGNALARLLARVLDSPGQTFLSVAEAVLRRPANQDVVVALFDTVGRYFSVARQSHEPTQDINTIITEAHACCAEASADQAGCDRVLAEVLCALPALKQEIAAMVALSRVDESIVIPIFSQTSAVGTLMRSKLEPVTSPLLREFAQLRGVKSPPASSS